MNKPEKFRKKPVEIEAMQVHYYYDDATRHYDYGNTQELLRWIGDDARVDIEPSGEMAFLITTLEGEMYAKSGDWIIEGVNGEFYPCKPDIFDKTYEKVEN